MKSIKTLLLVCGVILPALVLSQEAKPEDQQNSEQPPPSQQTPTPTPVPTEQTQEVSDNSTTTNSTTADYLNEKKEDLQSLQCFIYSSFSFYDLTNLTNQESDYTVTSLKNGYQYNFNFCRFATNPCATTEDEEIEAYGFRYNVKNVAANQCVALSDDSYFPETVVAVQDNAETKKVAHIYYSLGNGAECGDSDTSSISFEIFCDQFAVEQPKNSDFTLNDTDPCNPRITFTHASGCPAANLNGFVAWISENPWVIALFFIFVGPFINFYGRKFFPRVIGIVSGIAVFFASMFFLSIFGMLDYMNQSSSEQTGASIGLLLFAFFFSLILAIVVGWLMMTKFLLVGFCILGGMAMFFAGGLLYNLVLIQWVQSQFILWTCTFGGAALGAYLAYKFNTGIVILATSFLGAYIFIRGFGMLLGGFPSEMDLYQQVQSGQSNFSSTFIAYIAMIGVFTLAGIIFQARDKSHEDHDYFKKVKSDKDDHKHKH